MNIKVYTLSTCSTSKKILKELNLNTDNSNIQDIKFEKIMSEQIDEMKELGGSYGCLFNKRALKYKNVKPSERELTEDEMRKLIIKEYTFLKRPVILIDNQIFIGNSKKNIEILKLVLANI